MVVAIDGACQSVRAGSTHFRVSRARALRSEVAGCAVLLLLRRALARSDPLLDGRASIMCDNVRSTNNLGVDLGVVVALLSRCSAGSK
jgi:hypothetical protein